MRKYFYITEAEAREAGMTHEGRLFGVPAWLAENGTDEVVGAPKVPLLQLWCIFCDFLLEVGSYMISEENELVTPITLGRKL